MPDLYFDVDVALAEVPVNLLPLIDDTDFKTREVAIAFNAAGMDLVWNFVTSAGAYTQTAVTPTSAGDYDWAHQGDGLYSIEIPASGGASINNDTEGYGWFSGVATGVLPWRGPVIGFRAAGLNDLLLDSAFSATRGLAGTALPNAAAEAAGGLYTRGTGAGQINQQANGQIDSNLERWINVAPLALSSQRVQVLVGAITNGVIAAATFAANALDAVWSTAARTLTAATNITSTGGTTVPQTGDSFARLGAPAGASVSADIAAVKVDTAAILVDTGTTLDGRIPAALVGGRMDASVGAMAAGVLTATAIAADAITDAKVAADVTIASVTGAVGSVTGNVGGNVVGSVGSLTTNNDKTGYRLSATGVDDLLDDAIGDGTITMRQALRVILAASAGKLSGAATATITIRNTADSANVIVATVDADGNRSAVTVTP